MAAEDEGDAIESIAIGGLTLEPQHARHADEMFRVQAAGAERVAIDPDELLMVLPATTSPSTR